MKILYRTDKEELNVCPGLLTHTQIIVHQKSTQGNMIISFHHEIKNQQPAERLVWASPCRTVKNQASKSIARPNISANSDPSASWGW